MEKTKIKYFLYSRKSSESEDRQVQSIDDQISRLKALASDLRLDIKEVITESHSAKTPNARPIFNKMLERIEAGEANGILCWQINRLSRNPVDSARVQWLLQQRVIKSIQTMDGERKPDDNAVLLSVEAGVSNQYIIDLRKNVKRGLYSRVEKGWLPCLAPFGYKNDPETKNIIKDENIFYLIRRMWDLMLTGNYSTSKILDIANNEWGFKTVKRKRIGGKPLSSSGLYKILNNSFYAGIINYGGKTFAGKHETMVSVEEFDRVQMLLGKRGKRRPKIKDFAYTGIIKCGECGGGITAEDHQKIIKSTKEVKTFTYYRCTHKKKYIKCTQKGAINLNNLEKLISNKLDEYTIMPEFLDLSLDILNENEEQEIQKEIKIYQNQTKELSKLEENLSNLIRMRYQNLIDDAIFLAEKETLTKSIDILKNKSIKVLSSQNYLELTKKAFDFSTYAKVWFENGTNQDRRTILNSLGLNQTLKDKKLFITTNKWLESMNQGYKSLEDDFIRIELEKKPLKQEQKVQLDFIISQWRKRRDSNPRASFTRPSDFESVPL